MAEFSRARRTDFKPQATRSPKSQPIPGKASIPSTRSPPPLSHIMNTGTVSHLSLLNKVDVDTATVGKNTIQFSSIEKTPEHITRTMKSVSATSQDMTLKLNQTSIKTISSNSELIIPSLQQDNDERKDDLTFSITDITD